MARTKKNTNKTATETVSVFDQILSLKDATFGLIVSELEKDEAMMECFGDLMGDSVQIGLLIMNSTEKEWNAWRNRSDIVKLRNNFFESDQ